MKKSRLFKFNF